MQILHSILLQQIYQLLGLLQTLLWILTMDFSPLFILPKCTRSLSTQLCFFRTLKTFASQRRGIDKVNELFLSQNFLTHIFASWRFLFQELGRRLRRWVSRPQEATHRFAELDRPQRSPIFGDFPSRMRAPKRWEEYVLHTWPNFTFRFHSEALLESIPIFHH